MSDLSSRQVKWFVLVVALVLIPVTYLLSASGKVQVNAEALQLFAPLPAVMSSPDNPVTDAKVTLEAESCTTILAFRPTRRFPATPAIRSMPMVQNPRASPPASRT